MILSLCSNPAITKIMDIINVVIKLIRIAVPIILILYCMFDLVRAIFNGELGKSLSMIVWRLITAVLVFLIPVIVNFIIGIVDPGNQYGKCLKLDNDLVIRINSDVSK
jgi:hypothetical protein